MLVHVSVHKSNILLVLRAFLAWPQVGMFLRNSGMRKISSKIPSVSAGSTFQFRHRQYLREGMKLLSGCCQCPKNVHLYGSLGFTGQGLCVELHVATKFLLEMAMFLKANRGIEHVICQTVPHQDFYTSSVWRFTV